MAFIVAQIDLETKVITEMSKVHQTKNEAKAYLAELAEGLKEHCMQSIKNQKNYSFTTSNNLGYKVLPVVDLTTYGAEEHLQKKIKRLVKEDKEN